MRSSRLTWLGAVVVFCALTYSSIHSQEPAGAPNAAAQATIRQARNLLEQDDPSNAVLLLENQLSTCQGDPEYLSILAQAYRKQFDRFQSEGKIAQAAALYDKLAKLQPQLPQSHPAKPLADTLAAPRQMLSVKDTEQAPAEGTLQAAQQAFTAGNYVDAEALIRKVQASGIALTTASKEQLAYCKLQTVAHRLNQTKGQPGEEKPQLEREVRAALELAPRLDFGRELLERLQVPPPRSSAAIRHLPNKEGGWLVSHSQHFKVYHQDNSLAEQVLQIAEQTRLAVCRKWLGQEVYWSQPCQIYVHPTAESYHRQSGMSPTAPGHSDYDADKNDASVIHYRRVFLRADHQHMLTAILPHEVTHVILNGQYGRKLLPRWADEGMAVLSEPYSRIGMHLEPLPKAYQERRSIGLAELFSIEAYPSDRSKVATFYGQSVCLVEYLTQLKGPQIFTAFMRSANQQGESAALQQHYGLTIEQLELRLEQWIVSERMPTLMVNR